MNIIATSASALTVLHFVLLILLAEIPSLVNGEAVPDGVRLVMKTRSGDTLIRASRGALIPEETAVTPETNVDSQRIRNNRKSNRSQSQDHFQQAGGHKSGNRKHATAENGSAVVSQQHPKHKQGHKNNNNNNNNKQQRQQHQHGHQPHQGGKRSGSKEKASVTGASTCRYAKSAWSNCDAKTNMRTRILSLKKEEQNCLPTRTIQKKCKKGCRYEKGTWTQCNAGKMTREDKLQVEGNGGSDQNCDPVRTVNKKCKGIGSALEGKHHGPNRATKERKQKEKGTRRSSQQE